MRFFEKGIRLKLAQKLLKKDKNGNFYFILPEVTTPAELKKLISFFFGINESKLMFRTDFKIGKEKLSKKQKLIRKLGVLTDNEKEIIYDCGYFYLEPLIFEPFDTNHDQNQYRNTNFINLFITMVSPYIHYIGRPNYEKLSEQRTKNYIFIKECLKIRNINYLKFYNAFFNGVFCQKVMTKSHTFPNLTQNFDRKKAKYYGIKNWSQYSIYMKSIKDNDKLFFENFDKLVKTNDKTIRPSFKEALKKLKKLNEK